MIPRTIPFLAALLLATASALAAPAQPPKPEAAVTVESLLVQAHAAIGKGDTELALRLAQAAIVADPARPTSYVALGDIYAEAGQPDYARNFYDAALGIDPAEPSALKARSALDRSHPETTARASQ
ncbi:MAG TPA: tetratricopeptide repeat protein [Rhizomicrobium sp.]|nr:tetratricopeptide repeat protein [Rhizomicrobium sp.]